MNKRRMHAKRQAIAGVSFGNGEQSRQIISGKVCWNRSMNLKETTIADVQTAVRSARPSATELAEQCYREIEEQNPSINAYLAFVGAYLSATDRPGA